MADKQISAELKFNVDGEETVEGLADGLENVGEEADKSGVGLTKLGKALDAKTAAIKAALREEQSEIELQRQQLEYSRQQQQEILRAAKARGDESAATQAQNQLRQIESQQLELIARAKRAEADAVSKAAAAKHQELAASGPLTAAQTAELKASENFARALRVEAAAATEAALRTRGLTEAHQSGAGAADKLSERLGGVTKVLGQLGASLGAAFTFRELVTAAAQMEQLRSGLTAVTGDAIKAGQELEFVRAVAGRIGADVTEVGKAFLGLSASTRGTAVEGQATRDVFDAVATAMGKAGRSSAETSNALNALAQMASKGVVQSEELRGQLGEALPGALNAAAKGLGITTKELMDMVEGGEILAQDLFPALTKGLNELYGSAPQAQTLTQEITNIKNAVAELGNNLGEAGGLSALKTGAELAQTAIVYLDIALVQIGKTLGTLAAAAVNMDFSQLKQSFADIEKEAQDKLLKAAQHNGVLREAIKGVGDEALRTRLAQQEQAEAARRAAAGAEIASAGYIKLGAAYKEAQKNLSTATELAEKELLAVKARGDAAVAEAKLKNDEIGLRKAVGKAAADEAVSLAELAKRRQAEVNSLKLALEQKEKALKASADTSEGRKKEIAELKDLIAKKELEADRTRAQAAESKAHARAKGEEVQAAQEAVSAAKASAIAKKADSDATISLLQTQRALAGQAAEMATLMGDEELARMYRIKQMEIDIEITKAKAVAMRAEAQGSIEVANATMAELRVKGELTPVKEAELRASIKVAEAKLKEADAIRQSTGLTQQVINNLREYGGAASRAGAAGQKAGEDTAAGFDKAAASTSRAAAEAKKYDDYMRSRFEGGWAKDTDGNTVNAAMPEWQMNQYVARAFGEQYVGMAEANKAATLKMQLDYFASKQINTDYDGSLIDMRRELERLKKQMADSLQKSAAANSDAQTAGMPSKPASGGGSSAAGSGSSGGISTGSSGIAQPANYTSYITVEGETSRMDFTDRDSQDAAERTVARIAKAKRRAR